MDLAGREPEESPRWSLRQFANLAPSAMPVIPAGAEFPPNASVLDFPRECQSEVLDCTINASYQGPATPKAVRGGRVTRSELPEFGRFPRIVRLALRIVIGIAEACEVWYQESVRGRYRGDAGLREVPARSSSGRMP
jgi:hypothetical protein